jgi:hypothetical protein
VVGEISQVVEPMMLAVLKVAAPAGALDRAGA